MSDKVVLPLKIEVLSPRPSGVLPRGRNALKGADPQRAFRCPDSKWIPIETACDLLGMTTPEFIRWVSYAAANEVIRIANEQKLVVPNKVIEVVNNKPQSLVADPTRVVLNPYGLK